MKQIWKDVSGFDGYQVNEDGQIRSFVNNRHGVKSTDSRMLKPVPNKHGYDTVCLGRGNRKLVHRLVASAFIPNPNNLPIVRHLDDNPKNNRVDNLAWGTQTDNMRDCVTHGRLVGDTRSAIEARKMRVTAISENGERIDFSSIHDAARGLDLWPQHISNVLHGRLRQTGGYRFEFSGGDK